MRLQYLTSCRAKTAQELTADKFVELVTAQSVYDAITEVRAAVAAGDENAKKRAKSKLPAFMPMGADPSGQGSRKATDLEPTGLVMIDLDHVTDVDVRQYGDDILDACRAHDCAVGLIHVTPSGQGIRVVFAATQPFPSIKEHMDWFVRTVLAEVGIHGDYDAQCHDFSRLSYLPFQTDIIYMDEKVLFAEERTHAITCAVNLAAAEPALKKPKAKNTSEAAPAEIKTIEIEGKTDYEYHGTRVAEIVKRYMEVKGEPEDGQRHSFYNALVKNFRNLVNNDPQALAEILPTFGEPKDKRLSQCLSICARNSTTRHSKAFYAFLAENDFIPKDDTTHTSLRERIAEEVKEENIRATMPPLPPVFAEYVKICPKGFEVATINMLAAYLGTLTSFAVADNWANEQHHCTWYALTSAPPASGKSKLIEMGHDILRNLEIRDQIQRRREAIYAKQKKQAERKEGAEEPTEPPISIRLFSSQTSLPKLLKNMKSNCGYNGIEICDEWASHIAGLRAGGSSNKDPLFLTGYNNEVYSQDYMSADTFRGTVRIGLNIVACTTPSTLIPYFSKHMGDGLGSRFTFGTLGVGDFAEQPIWKKMSKKDRARIDAILDRCERMSYKEPLTTSIEDINKMSDREFLDSHIADFEFLPQREYDMRWTFKTFKAWLEKTRKEACRRNDYAMDQYYKRSAVRAFRLALIARALYGDKEFGDTEKKLICDFALWWADLDLAASLALFGATYNERHNAEQKTLLEVRTQPQLFSTLGEDFTKDDVANKATQLRIYSKVDNIVSQWKGAGLITKIAKNQWRKVTAHK